VSDLLDDVVAAAGLTVFGAASVPGSIDAHAQLAADAVAQRLADADPTLWGADASRSLGWLAAPERSRALLPRIAEVRAELRARGLDHVVLCGMGGSSLAPEVIARTLGVELTVLDSTDPHQVRAALADRLDRTVVVVASKSGTTVETDSHRRAYLQAFEDAGLQDLGRRFVIVTDPGSPLETTAREMGAHLFLADPTVGGRYSALTAFGLVPSGLAGAHVAELLDEAAALFAPPPPSFSAGFSLSAPRMSASSAAADNPGLALGAALAAGALAGRDKLALASDGTGLDGLPDWIEQLVAESTGKRERGLVPVVLESPTAWGHEGDDVLSVTVGGALGTGLMPGGGIVPDLAVNGPLGAQFLAWEYATAVAGLLLGVDPFDQPNVDESKENTRRILDAGLPRETPAFVDGAVEIYGDTTATTLIGAIDELARGVQPHGYLAVLAFLDRIGDASAAGVRALLAARVARAVTFGWGPRYLHSTGQLHKGGPQIGSFLQITGVVTEDLRVPGRPYTFGELQAAQAAGDRQALLGRGRPLLRLHLTDRTTGIEQLLAALGG
jgi:glucose-6-phosphate isomerase